MKLYAINDGRSCHLEFWSLLLNQVRYISGIRRRESERQLARRSPALVALVAVIVT